MPLRVPAVVTGLEASIQAQAKKAGRNLKLNLGTSAKSIEGLSQPLGRITGKADQFTKSMEAANARVLAFGASVGVLSAVTQGFKELVNTTIQVEKQLASINSILGGTVSELNKFKKEIFDVARNTEQSFDTVATAALELSRQGLKAEEVTKRLNDALILSRLSGLGASEAVSGLTAAINSFNSSGVTSAEVLNKLSAASIKAAVSERDLIEGIKRAGSVAQIAGVSLDELVGVISAVQERTARGGAVIGNSFKTIFTRIQSLDKLKTMQDLGVQVTDASGAVLSGTKLIQNLGKVIQDLPEAKQLQIAENLVGKFQIAPFLALLDDYNSKTSKAIQITEVAANATNQAYSRNIALNKTLAAAINEATVNLKELANTLGEIGITDSLQNVLGFFNTLVTNIKDLLEGEGVGATFAKGIVKGIGGVLAGPGLAIFGAIIAKLTIDLVKFGTGSLKTFFGLNKAAQRQATLQGQIASTLLGNKGIQEQILAIENSTLTATQKRAAQSKFFTTALNEQLRVMTQMQAIAGRIAPAVARGTRGRGAGGYIPNFNAASGYGSESSDIKRGVGGAPASARPVTIPNFNFGGGQRGTMVANSSEYIVPNFAGGSGSAIFNQNMVATMGLPTGARKIGAARGYIPNFVEGSGYSFDQLRDLKLTRGATGSERVKPDSDLKKIEKGKDAGRAAAARSVLDARQKGKTTFFANQPKGGGGFIMLIPEETGYDPDRADKAFENPFKRAQFDQTIDFYEGAMAGINPALRDADTAPAKKYRKLANLQAILTEELEQGVKKAIQSVVELIKPGFKVTKALDEGSVVDSLEKGGQGAFGALRGAAFEKIMNIVLGSLSDPGSELDVVLGSGKKKDAIELIFGLPENIFERGDFKNSSSIGNKNKFVKQVLNSPYRGSTRTQTQQRKGKTTKARTSASGYIPSFAVSPLDAAVGREAAAGVPINQIRINQSPKLRNAGNPSGLAVTNMRDEPTGAIPNFIRRSEKLGLGKNPTSATSRQGSFAEFEAGAAAAGAAAKKMSETTARAAKGAAELGKESKKETKARRDLLGPIFAVQAGLSFLTAATEGSSSALAQYTNIITDALGGATTAVFAGEALSDFGDSLQEKGGAITGKLGAVVGGLGKLTGAVGIAFSAVKLGGELMDKWTGVTDTATLAMDLVGESAKNAAFRLDNLNPAAKRGVEQEAGAVLGSVVGGGFLSGAAHDVAFEGFEWFKVVDGKLEKALRESVKVAILNNIPSDKIKRELDIISQDKFVDQNEVLRVVKAFDIMAEKGKEAVSEFLKLEDLSIEGFTSEEVKGILTKGIADISEFKVVGGKLVGGELTGEMRGATDAQFKEMLNLGRGANPIIDALRDRIVAGGGSDSQDIQNEQIFNLRKKLIDDEAKAAEAARQKKIALARISARVATEEIRVAIERAKLDKRALDAIDEKILKGSLLKNLSIRETADLQLQKKEAESNLKIRNLTFDTVNSIVAASKELTFVEQQSEAVMSKINQIRSASLATEEERSEVLKITRDLISENSAEVEAQITPLLNNLDVEKERLETETERFKRTQDITTEIKIQTSLLQHASKAEARRLSSLTTTESRTIREGISEREQALERARIGTKSGFEERALRQRAAAEAIINARDEQRAGQLERDAQQKNELRDIFNQQSAPIRQAMGAGVGFGFGATGEDIVRGTEGLGIGRQAEKLAETLEFQERLKAEQKLKREGRLIGIEPETVREQAILNQVRLDAAGNTLTLIDKLRDFSNTAQGAQSEAARLNEAQNENLKIAKDLADTYDQLSLSQAASNFLDSLIEGRGQARFDALTSTDPTALLKQNIRDRNFAAKMAALERDQDTGELVRGEEGLRELQEILAREELTDNIIDAGNEFAQTMGGALVDAIARAGNLGDALQIAATNFLNKISEAFTQSAVDQLVGSITGGGGTGGGGTGGAGGGGFFAGLLSFFTGRNRGGIIAGGSGNRDDVPTLLTSGEFVIKKGSVQKYGRGFLEDLNEGQVPKMKTGGYFNPVSQRGRLFSPGTYGQGSITGKRDLLDFATQSQTGGQFDRLSGGAGFAAVELEPQSARLTMFGRRNSPLFQREQDSKREAFGLFARQVQHEKQLKEQEKQRKKAFRNSLIAAAASVAFSQFATGFSESMKSTKGTGKGPLSRIFSATGAGITGFKGEGGQRFGGLLNFETRPQGPLPSVARARNARVAEQDFSSLPPLTPQQQREMQQWMGVGPVMSPEEIEALNLDNVGIGRGILPQKPDSSDPFNPNFVAPPPEVPGIGQSPARARVGNAGFEEREAFLKKFAEQIARDLGEEAARTGNFPGGVRKAAGGYISPTAGVDTVPSMLSGGEFVMNAAATQRMGRGNLAALNGGGGVGGDDEAIVARLDELIAVTDGSGETVINITVNSDGTETQDGEGDEGQQNLALKIKDVVRQTIEEEKRLGGSLRRN